MGCDLIGPYCDLAFFANGNLPFAFMVEIFGGHRGGYIGLQSNWYLDHGTSALRADVSRSRWAVHTGMKRSPR